MLSLAPSHPNPREAGHRCKGCKQARRERRLPRGHPGPLDRPPPEGTAEAPSVQEVRWLGSLAETSGDPNPKPVRFGFPVSKAWCVGAGGRWLHSTQLSCCWALDRGSRGQQWGDDGRGSTGAGRIRSSPQAAGPSSAIQTKERTSTVLQSWKTEDTADATALHMGHSTPGVPCALSHVFPPFPHFTEEKTEAQNSVRNTGASRPLFSLLHGSALSDAALLSPSKQPFVRRGGREELGAGEEAPGSWEGVSA